MQIKFANPRQVEIADLLWEANSEAEVDAIIAEYGHDARVVRMMLIAAAYDQITDTDLANEVIDNIRNK